MGNLNILETIKHFTTEELYTAIQEFIAYNNKGTISTGIVRKIMELSNFKYEYRNVEILVLCEVAERLSLLKEENVL